MRFEPGAPRPISADQVAILNLQKEINDVLLFAMASSPVGPHPERISEDGLWGPVTERGLRDALDICANQPTRRDVFDVAYLKAWSHIPMRQQQLPPPAAPTEDPSLVTSEVKTVTKVRQVDGEHVATASIPSFGLHSACHVAPDAPTALRAALAEVMGAYVAGFAPVPQRDALDFEVTDADFEL